VSVLTPADLDTQASYHALSMAESVKVEHFNTPSGVRLVTCSPTCLRFWDAEMADQVGGQLDPRG
jgi:hypothetical protein